MKNLDKKKFVFFTFLLCGLVVFASGIKDEEEIKSKNEMPSFWCNINIDYPVFETEPVLNTFLKNNIAEIYTNFNKTVILDIERAGSYELIIKAGSVNKENDYISFILSAYEYNAGAAHGLTSLIPVNYNTKTKKIVSLEEALNPNSKDWLVTLSEEARKQLMDQNKKGLLSSDNEWIKKGTEPIVSNFKNFEIEKNHIKIVFDSYQVAPYSSGMPEIKIPLNFFN